MRPIACKSDFTSNRLYIFLTNIFSTSSPLLSTAVKMANVQTIFYVILLIPVTLISLIGILFLFVSTKQLLTTHKGPKLPNPKWYPFVGNLLMMLPNDKLSTDHKLCKFYGNKNFAYYIFSKRTINIRNVTTAKEVLALRPKIFRRPKRFVDCPICFGHGLFAAESSDWQRIRRLTGELFCLHMVDGLSLIAGCLPFSFSIY